MATIYRIKGWNQYFENDRTRRVEGPLRRIMVPNKHDGEGYKTIMAEPDGIIIYGCWHLILQVASKCWPRGTLTREDGTPHTAKSMSIKSGWHKVSDIQRALDFCSSPEVGWIESSDSDGPGVAVPQVHAHPSDPEPGDPPSHDTCERLLDDHKETYIRLMQEYGLDHKADRPKIIGLLKLHPAHEWAKHGAKLLRFTVRDAAMDANREKGSDKRKAHLNVNADPGKAWK